MAQATPTVPLPTTTTSQPPQPATPDPPAPTATPPAAPTTGADADAVLLRPGARGADVTRLQRAIRARGVRVAVDGHYGPGTVRSVRTVQRRWKMRVTGLATAALVKRLGVKVRQVASTPASTPLQDVAPTPSGSAYLTVFPVATTTYGYSDDFGDPRHQGRHEGCDIIENKTGAPLVAVADGEITRVQRVEKGLGGIYIWMRDAKGTDFYYAHMETIRPEIVAGLKVTAGQPVGTMGMTGDARGTVPHLHFEIRPAGSVPINPYPELVKVDPKKRR